MPTIRDHSEGFKFFIEGRTMRPSDDIVIPNKLVFHYFEVYKKRLIKELDLINKYDIHEELIKILPCIQMREVDIVECPCAPASGCTFAKSVLPIPKFYDKLPLSVNDVSGGTEFSYVPWHDFKYRLQSRIPAQRNAPYYTLKTVKNETYLYLYNRESIKASTITAVPRDEIEFAEFPECGIKKEYLCDVLDIDYSIPSELESLLYERVYNTLRAMKALAPMGDILNNDNDDTEQPQDPNQ